MFKALLELRKIEETISFDNSIIISPFNHMYGIQANFFPVLRFLPTEKTTDMPASVPAREILDKLS